MTPTFLIAVDTGSDTDLLSIASDIHDALLNAGFEVQSVKPWQQGAVKGLVAAPPSGTFIPPPSVQTGPPIQPSPPLS